jgi:hypothetical protein
MQQDNPSRRRFNTAAAASLAVGLAPATARAETNVDLQLALAVDASGSVSQYRFELQKRGYVNAFRNPKVLNAVMSGLNQSIAVTMFQWTGPRLQREVAPWMILKDEASAAAIADRIESVPRLLFGGGTSISGAIDVSMQLFPRGDFRGARRVIDISGDGANTSGRPVTRARDDAVAAGVTINGLPILSVEPDLDEHYQEFVIGGEGAFMIAIKSFEDFADAILKKLIAEIAANDYQKRG